VYTSDRTLRTDLEDSGLDAWSGDYGGRSVLQAVTIVDVVSVELVIDAMLQPPAASK